MKDIELRNFLWAYALMVAFAQYILEHEPILDGHVDCNWDDLVGTSHSMYMHQARDFARINHDVFLKDVRNGKYPVDDLYETNFMNEDE